MHDRGAAQQAGTDPGEQKIQVAADQIVNQQLIEGGGGHGAQQGFGIGLPEVVQKQ